MTDYLSCTPCSGTQTQTQGTSASNTSPNVSFVGDRWAGAAVECNEYTPIREGNTRTTVGKATKPTPEAEEKARKLLMKFLGKKRFKKAEKSGFIDIASKLHASRIYKIPFRGGRIQVEEKGKVIEALCFYIKGDSLPLGDRVLAKTLFAKYDEEELLKIANHMSPDDENEGYGDYADAG